MEKSQWNQWQCFYKINKIHKPLTRLINLKKKRNKLLRSGIKYNVTYYNFYWLFYKVLWSKQKFLTMNSKNPIQKKKHKNM